MTPTQPLQPTIQPLHQTIDGRVKPLFFATVLFILYSVACEMVLAPLKPGGSLLALKVIPLMFLLPGLIQGRFRSLQALCMLILIYAAEGFVRGMSDPSSVRLWGWVGAGLSTAIFLGTMLVARAVKQSKMRPELTAEVGQQ